MEGMGRERKRRQEGRTRRTNSRTQEAETGRSPGLIGQPT